MTLVNKIENLTLSFYDADSSSRFYHVRYWTQLWAGFRALSPLYSWGTSAATRF